MWTNFNKNILFLIYNLTHFIDGSDTLGFFLMTFFNGFGSGSAASYKYAFPVWVYKKKSVRENTAHPLFLPKEIALSCVHSTHEVGKSGVIRVIEKG